MRALLLAVAAVALAGCGGSEPELVETQPPPAGGPAATVPAADDPIAGETLTGEQLALDDFRGRTVFVNVWSSW